MKMWWTKKIAKTLDELNNYIPMTATNKDIILPNGDTVNHQDFDIIRIPITGDQVIVARIRAAQLARHSSEKKQCVVV